MSTASPCEAAPEGASLPNAPDVDLFQRTVGEVRQAGRFDLLAALTAVDNRALGRTGVVVVLGPPGSGKSRLLDALLGVRICSGWPGVGTRIPVVLGWSETPLASAVRCLGGAALPVRDALKLGDVAAVASRAEPEPAAWLEVLLPRRLTRDGLVLVDTCGAVDGLSGPTATHLIGLATAADTVIYVVDAQQGTSRADVELLGYLAEHGLELVLALTRTDLYPAWRDSVARERELLRAARLAAPVLPLTAPVRERGLRHRDPQLLAACGYSRLVQRLRVGALARVRQRAALMRLGGARSALDHLRLADEEPESRRRASPTRSGAVRASPLPRLRSLRHEFRDALGEADVVLSADLAERLSRVREHARAWLRDESPAEGWAEVGSRLFAPVVAELRDHRAEVQTLVERLAGEADGLLAGHARRLAVELDINDVPVLRTVSAARLLSGLRALECRLALPEAPGTPSEVLHVLALDRGDRKAGRAAVRAARAGTLAVVEAYLDACHESALLELRTVLAGLEQAVGETADELETVLHGTAGQLRAARSAGRSQASDDDRSRRDALLSDLVLLEQRIRAEASVSR